jgi:CheY-like chemotaxis protein
VPEPIRILLVEDNEIFRSALELLLGIQEGFEVVGSVGDGTGAAPACRALTPDVIVMDYRLPGMDGVEATAAVREAGAVACLRKDQALEEIVVAIKRAAAERTAA